MYLVVAFTVSGFRVEFRVTMFKGFRVHFKAFLLRFSVLVFCCCFILQFIGFSEFKVADQGLGL